MEWGLVLARSVVCQMAHGGRNVDSLANTVGEFLASDEVIGRGLHFACPEDLRNLTLGAFMGIDAGQMRVLCDNNNVLRAIIAKGAVLRGKLLCIPVSIRLGRVGFVDLVSPFVVTSPTS